jgi:ABC-type polysaccharide/polyol phosphate transport system ATPase subunit
MSDIAVRVEDLGKWYRIGERAHDKNVREAFTALMKAPYGMVRHHRLRGVVKRREAPSFWALRHVSFEIHQGDLLGVIGLNGAGKSTLLKILSQITQPTEGEAEIRGHVRALLEVGMGFHPELTGRENILLNGAILGMKRAEINRKFDEIISFAEIERFIDTPVKWYSTGMYTRLAFSVAAHLEPDVLIVDEVLAVGDAGFQRKCLAKMGNVAAGGRTVIFVSHMMHAVSQLTERCVVLKNGALAFDGPTEEAVKLYQSFQQTPQEQRAQYDAPHSGGHNHVASARVLTTDPAGVHRWGEPIVFEFALQIGEPHDSLCFSFQVLNEHQQPICHFWLYDAASPFRHHAGRFRLQCEIPRFRLYMGNYTVRTLLTERRSNTVLEALQGICPFNVTMHGVPREEYQWEPGAAMYLEDAAWLPVEREDEPLLPSAGGLKRTPAVLA